MGGNGHDGPRPVLHKNKVGHINGHPVSREGIDAVRARKNPLFLRVLQGTLPLGLPLHPFNEGQHLVPAGVALQKLLKTGILRGHTHKGHPIDGIGPGGEDLYGLSPLLQGKPDEGPLRSAYPVPLHGEDALRPSPLELLQALQEFLGIVGGLEEPLLKLLLHHFVAASPAASPLHLFVGQYGMAVFTPVDVGLFAIGQTPLQHLDEDLLLPLVVLLVTGGQLPGPVVAESQAFELASHVVDVLVGPLGGMNTPLDGGVFGREAKGIPSHGMQNVVTPHGHEPGHHIANGVVPDVAHVDPARGIGKHLQAVVFGLAGLLFHPVEVMVLPVLLPLEFYSLGIVFFHFHSSLGC